MAVAYILPLGAGLILLVLLRAPATARVIAVLVIIPLVVALIGTDIYFAIPGRTIRKWGLHFIADRQVKVVAAGLRRRGIDAYPWLGAAEFGYGRWIRRVGSDSILPLAGISGKTTVLCAEGDLIVTFASDELGFNNPRGLWKPGSIDIAVVGDSFVLGACVPPGEHFVSLLRNEFPGTVNTGELGNGPISELAILREYVAPMRPHRVLWVFFEGNDMEDLDSEKKSFLTNYFDPRFSQHLLSRQRDADAALTTYAKSTMELATRARPLRQRLRDIVMLHDLRTPLGLEAGAAERDVTPDYVTLSRVFSSAATTVGDYGGKLTIAYLPEQHRLDHSARQPLGRHHDENDIRTHVLEIARGLGLPVIDVGDAFARDEDPKALWWRPRTHLSPYGNRKLAKAILERLR